MCEKFIKKKQIYFYLKNTKFIDRFLFSLSRKISLAYSLFSLISELVVTIRWLLNQVFSILLHFSLIYLLSWFSIDRTWYYRITIKKILCLNAIVFDTVFRKDDLKKNLITANYLFLYIFRRAFVHWLACISFWYQYWKFVTASSGIVNICCVELWSEKSHYVEEPNRKTFLILRYITRYSRERQLRSFHPSFVTSWVECIMKCFFFFNSKIAVLPRRTKWEKPEERRFFFL